MTGQGKGRRRAGRGLERWSLEGREKQRQKKRSSSRILELEEETEDHLAAGHPNTRTPPIFQRRKPRLQSLNAKEAVCSCPALIIGRVRTSRQVC